MRREEIDAVAKQIDEERAAFAQVAADVLKLGEGDPTWQEGAEHGMARALFLLREALAKMTPATFCSQCGHFAHVAGSCNHGYSPCPTVAFPDGMREDAAGSGCVCGLYREGACERVKS